MPLKVVFFTVSVDKDDHVLAHTFEWVKAIAYETKEVSVFARHVGNVKGSPSNVKYFNLGGGSWTKRARGLFRALLAYFSILRKSRSKQEMVVIYHMVTWPILIFGPLNKFISVKQGLWYSHNYADIRLRLLYRLIDCCFAPTILSFPLSKVSNLVATGHALEFKGADDYSKLLHLERNMNKIYCIGRIARVKNLECLIEAVSEINYEVSSQKFSVVLIGPVQDRQYLEFLMDRAISLKLDCSYIGALNRRDLVAELVDIGIVFNGTPKSVDKASLEAASMGALVVSENRDLLFLSGMSDVWQKMLHGRPSTLKNQIMLMSGLSRQESIEARRITMNLARSRNNIEKVVRKMLIELGA